MAGKAPLVTLLRVSLELRLQRSKFCKRRIRIRLLTAALICRTPGSRRAILLAPTRTIAATRFLGSPGPFGPLGAMLTLGLLLMPAIVLTASTAVAARTLILGDGIGHLLPNAA